jgi:hypothetical protein
VAISSILAKRFLELEEQTKDIESTKAQGDFGMTRIDGSLLLNWKTKVRNLLSAACGKESEHYISFLAVDGPSMYRGNYEELQDLIAVFQAAKEDYEGGYITSIRALVQAEVFDTELDQARELLTAGYYSPSAVVAGVVLETTLLQLCADRGILVGKLDKMNADLVKANAYNVSVQKRVTALADIRNNAAHGHPERFTAEDVGEMISYLERFLADHL